MKNKSEKNSGAAMTELQKKAVIMCAVCALAVVVTASVTGVLVSGRVKASKTEIESEIAKEEGYNGSEYQIDESSSAVLAQTSDAGESYLMDTLFLGDSNTVRFYNNDLLSPQQFCAQTGLGIQSATTEKFVTFKKDSAKYTIPEAVAKMKPRRVVITLGTNNGDGSMSTEDFISEYRKLITAIKTAYEYTDIIVNAVPPVPASHSSYPDIDQKVLDDFNMALAKMCETDGLYFLNSTEVLKDSTGYGQADYYVSGDIHLKMSGLKAILTYARMHALNTEDRRPDTSNIAIRIQDNISGTTANNTTATPSATPSVLYTAKYLVGSAVGSADGSAVGGTLTSGSESGKSSLIFNITDKKQSVTVQAVPQEGYLFIKWSDGSTAATRTDKDFTQNVNVTAMFAKVGVSISGSGTIEAGKAYSFVAKLTSDNYGDLTKVQWYVSQDEGKNYTKEETVGSTFSLTPEAGKSYAVYAALEYNGKTVKSNVEKLAITATPTPTPTPTPTATATPTLTPTATATPSPTSDPAAVPTAEPTAAPTAEPTAVPTAEPTAVPTAEPAAEPTSVPTAESTAVSTTE